MIIFDEKVYAKDIIKNGYKTKKNQGVERCCLIRYLKNSNLENDSIISILDKIPFQRSECLKREDVLYIYNRLLNKALKYDYVADIEIGITDKEKLFIKELSKDVSFLAYVYLVYYKWAKNIKRYIFKYNNEIYVEYNEKDLWKLARLSNKNYIEKNKLDKKLISCEFLDVRVLKGKTFLKVKEIESVNYVQVLKGAKFNRLKDAYLVLTQIGRKLKQCECCGIVIEKVNNKIKYCKECARLENIRKTGEKILKQKHKEPL